MKEQNPNSKPVMQGIPIVSDPNHREIVDLMQQILDELKAMNGWLESIDNHTK